jgi:hypothetical protein
MDRPTKITVIEKNDGYEIICIDEMSGSSIGIDLPINGYKALSEHFRTGALEISSDELGNCNKPHVSNSFCECKNLNYGYTVPVCYNCRKVVDILAK